jgi:hypothetical protein
MQIFGGVVPAVVRKTLRVFRDDERASLSNHAAEPREDTRREKGATGIVEEAVGD